ncbi:MAG: metallophosphoesterase family protein [Bacillota bacterium]|jgi:predicted phosphodiesterase|nr:metallophosphoesterase family protein [Bacillota bacterium]HHT91476.1 hypothetical protein [Bacillota bacterium]
MKQFIKDRRRHLPVLFVFVGLVLFINLFSTTDFRLLSVMVNLRLELGYRPQTQISLPPIGEITATTHWLPVRLRLELRSIDLALLRGVVFSPAPSAEEVWDAIRQDAQRMVSLFALKLLALGSLGAVFLLYLADIRNPKQIMWGAVLGALTVLFVLGTLYFSYDPTGFERLEYKGIIEAAPWALNLAWQALDQVEELGERVQTLARDLYTVLQDLETLGPLGLVNADILALHVSDIHNNPVAYNFAKQVIDSFPVDFVMDTGDITDWGTALEAEITARIGELEIPYLFVSGNHDSPDVLARLSTIENAVVISQEEQIVLGLTIAGTGDLVADSYLATPASYSELDAYAAELNRYWSNVEPVPDIFMVHNHRLAEGLTPGLFPLVVYGHTHLWSVQEEGGTVYSNAGTTGAAGIRGFQGREPLPYSLSLLYFILDEEGGFVLQAIDGVHVTGLGTSFSLQRTFVEHGRNHDENVELLP